MALDRRNWLELLKFMSNFGDFYVSIRAWPWDQWIAVDNNNLFPLKYVFGGEPIISQYGNRSSQLTVALDRRNWLELLKFVSNFGDFYVSIRAWPWDHWIAVDNNNLFPLKYVFGGYSIISQY